MAPDPIPEERHMDPDPIQRELQTRATLKDKAMIVYARELSTFTLEKVKKATTQQIERPRTLPSILTALDIWSTCSRAPITVQERRS